MLLAAALLLLLLLAEQPHDAVGSVQHLTLELAPMEFESAGLRFVTRAYNNSIPGPAIYLYPGETLELTLINSLAAGGAGSLPAPPSGHATPCSSGNCSSATTHGYTPFAEANSTNLHTHGLHTSPLAPGDDVLTTTVLPLHNFTYVYKIPHDHMGGTFWYRPIDQQGIPSSAVGPSRPAHLQI
jgi:FtsP/CotA-like multicopper oxidase with cupredoxin domain